MADTEGKDQERPEGPRSRRRALPVNVIAAAAVQSPKPPVPDEEVEVAPASRSARPSGDEARAGTTARDTSDDVPESVRDRFVKVGREYYFPDGAPAFRDHGRKLTTHSENVELVRSMVLIAQARGWEAIEVSGSERFRQTAWQAGVREGLQVRGYRPTPVERAREARRESPERTEAQQGRDRAAGEAPARNEKDAVDKVPLIKGDLVAHGRAPYQFHPQEQDSYYVTVRTKDGERTVWGKDLERAMTEASTRPEIGDPVGLQPVGRDPVTVRGKTTGDDGESTEKVIQTHRNRWVIERVELFEGRAGAARTLRDPDIAPTAGTELHPELKDAYLHLRAAELLAKGRMTNDVDGKAFVQLVREALAAATARGETLPAAKLKVERSRSATRGERSTERELTL